MPLYRYTLNGADAEMMLPIEQRDLDRCLAALVLGEPQHPSMQLLNAEQRAFVIAGAVREAKWSVRFPSTEKFEDEEDGEFM